MTTFARRRPSRFAPAIRRMRLRPALAVLAALAGAVTAPVALAPAQQDGRTSEVRDRRGDARGGLDVVRIALKRAAGGWLRGEVTMASEWATADLRGQRAPSSVCFRLYSRRDADAEPPDHLVCATPAKEGDALVGRVLRDRPNGLPVTVAEAAVTRPTARTLYLRFSRRSVRRPAELRFAVETVVHGRRCRRTLGCRDTAPAAPRTGALRLRASASRQ